MIDKVLGCLQHKILKNAMAERTQKLDQLQREHIYKMTCRLIEKILIRELQKST